MIDCCRSGVKGIVKDLSSKLPIVGAVVEVVGRRHSTKTTALGEYWRILLPGDYVLKVCVYYRYLNPDLT